jgi:hypothetical protein
MTRIVRKFSTHRAKDVRARVFRIAVWSPPEVRLNALKQAAVAGSQTKCLELMQNSLAIDLTYAEAVGTPIFASITLDEARERLAKVRRHGTRFEIESAQREYRAVAERELIQPLRESGMECVSPVTRVIYDELAEMETRLQRRRTANHSNKSNADDDSRYLQLLGVKLKLLNALDRNLQGTGRRER